MRVILFIAMAFSLSLQNTQAQTNTDSELSSANELALFQGAIDGASQFVDAVQKREFISITHEQMSRAVEELAQELLDRNDAELANELRSKWSIAQFSMFSEQKDLGDHAPLFPWLEDFITKMADKYGAIILTLPIVQDIRTLNFAIPVVFHPVGSWQNVDQDNRIEYRKHFIPFANIVTYYASYYGCVYIANHQGLGSQAKKVCKKLADKLKFLMGRYVAPPLSDWVFKTAMAQASSTSSSGTPRPLMFDLVQMMKEIQE